MQAARRGEFVPIHVDLRRGRGEISTIGDVSHRALGRKGRCIFDIDIHNGSHDLGVPSGKPPTQSAAPAHAFVARIPSSIVGIIALARQAFVALVIILSNYSG